VVEPATSTSSVPLPGPLASARDRPWPMVGRDSELTALASAWERIAAGGRETVLIAGEPGAGKSRLVAEAGAAAHAAGGMVLYGSGEETAGRPYAPFVAALAHLHRHATPGPQLDALRSSPLGRLLPGTDPGDAGPADWGLGDDRGRLFAATVEQLEVQAEQRPLMLVVDDLHGCGLSTLMLVEHLARADAALRLLLVATYRPTDLEPGDERAGLLARLRSAPGAQHIELTGLEASALRDIATSLQVAGEPEALDAIAATAERESAGNPLFACELLRAVREGGAGTLEAGIATPRSLRMLIGARAHALGAETHRHLSAAAVCGRTFDPRLVAAVLDEPGDALAASIRRAEHAGLIVSVPDGGGATFTHAIVARSLYEELDPAVRGRLHRQLAETLEAESAGRSPERAGELALHWRRADPPDPERAVRYCASAGTVALERYDHGVAAGWFEQALELRDGTGGAPDAERCDLLIGLGKALRFADQERSRVVLLEASRLADSLDDVDRLVEATLANHRGFVSHVGGFDRERGAMLRRTAERMSETGPRLALVLAQLALELTFSPQQVDRRRRLAERALAVARSSGDKRVIAQVLIRYLIAEWGPENPRDRIEAAAESIAISSQLDEPLDLFHGLHWQAVAQIELGEVRAAARTLREQERIASRIGDGTANWLCGCSASVHLALRGRLDAGEQRAQEAAELAQRSAQPDALPFYISQIASIRWQQGRLGELAPLLAQALDQYPGLPAFRSLVTLAHAIAGEEAFAREVLVIDAATGFADLPRDPIWIAAAATYAHAVAELRDAEAAALLHPVLDPYRGQLASATVSVWGLVDHALGRLELLLGDERSGRESLRRAISDYARMGAPVWQAQAERDLAAADGPLPPSDLDARIARLGLTPRQSEVVRLVAQGRSNKAVAAELHLSPSTVKRHLENAYDHTGARSRSALLALLLDVDGSNGPTS